MGERDAGVYAWDRNGDARATMFMTVWDGRTGEHTLIDISDSHGELRPGEAIRNAMAEERASVETDSGHNGRRAGSNAELDGSCSVDASTDILEMMR
jgi:hypothetical protein